MPQPQFYTKVYWKSSLEESQVKLRATLLGKRVSTYIRDLIITDLHYANLKPLLDTSDNRAEVKRLQQLGAEDPSGLVYHTNDDTPLRTIPYTAEEIKAAQQAETPEEEEQRLMREIREQLMDKKEPN